MGMTNAFITSQNAISREVKSSIARAGISQAKLAKALSISPGSLSEKINGKISFSIDDLLIIAGTLGLSLTELLGEALTSQRVPAPSYIEDEKGKKKVAPIGFIPNGTTYQMVAGAGFEPAASGL
ncbi:helix-turn-helix domain-containing protein [Rothia nasimurium]|uniref:helix-turn-helix domain-containing protein n=1 Tax=Rothia nasimurium TaxID=85336 RepID=UPI003C6E3A67